MKLNIDVLNLASDLASHAYRRQELIAQNVANADTPGYKARDLSKFTISNDDFETNFGMRKTRKEHFGTVNGSQNSRIVHTNELGNESPNGNSVTLEDQLVRSAEVQHQHEMALGVYQKSLAILRLSLGRRS